MADTVDGVVLAEDFSDVTLDDRIACVRRELAMRSNFYPRQVAAGRMTQTKADRELRHLSAVLQDLLRRRESRGLFA